MNFGEALGLLKAGRELTRRDWNGKGMFLYLVKGQKLASGLGYGFGEYSGEPYCTDFIVIRTSDNKIVPWVPSQADLLATDWELFV